MLWQVTSSSVDAMAGQAVPIGSLLLKMVLWLGLLAGVAWLVVWWGRRHGLVQTARHPVLTLLGRQALDAKHVTWLVEVRGRTLLLGGGAGHVACLADLTLPPGGAPHE